MPDRLYRVVRGFLGEAGGAFRHAGSCCCCLEWDLLEARVKARDFIFVSCSADLKHQCRSYLKVLGVSALSPKP